jgi:hypothetical protein
MEPEGECLMAESIKGIRRQNNIIGMRRVIVWDAVAFSANGDTLTVPGIKRIESVSFLPTTAPGVAISMTIVGNVATLVSGGALTGLTTVSGI